MQYLEDLSTDRHDQDVKELCGWNKSLALIGQPRLARVWPLPVHLAVHLSRERGDPALKHEVSL